MLTSERPIPALTLLSQTIDSSAAVSTDAGIAQEDRLRSALV